MRAFFGTMMVIGILLMLGGVIWTHRHIAVPEAVPEAKKENQSAEQKEAERLVTVYGPLADYMAKQNENNDSDNNNGDRPSTPREVLPSDLVGDSPVGTSSPLLHKTFTVTKPVGFSFTIPPHATGPQLIGTYQAFIPHVGRDKYSPAESVADVEFLLLNEEQFADFLRGRRGEAVFWANGARQQDVAFKMPPTFSQPVKYHIVFRDTASEGSPRVVRADFRLDF